MDNTEKNKVRLSVCGTEYVIVTEEDPRYVMSLGEELDRTVAQALSENSRLSVTQAILLAAIDYADKYKKEAICSDNLRSQIKDYAEESARNSMDAEIARREVERLTRELHNARSPKN